MSNVNVYHDSVYWLTIKRSSKNSRSWKCQGMMGKAIIGNKLIAFSNEVKVKFVSEDVLCMCSEHIVRSSLTLQNLQSVLCSAKSLQLCFALETLKLTFSGAWKFKYSIIIVTVCKSDSDLCQKQPEHSPEHTYMYTSKHINIVLINICLMQYLIRTFHWSSHVLTIHTRQRHPQFFFQRSKWYF